MIGNIAKKIFGSRNDRVLKGIAPLVDRVNQLEAHFKNFTDVELKELTAKYKERVAQGEDLENILPEAFAIVREASRRVLGMRHFDVQLVGGVILHRGMISEMGTGEGKTLVATLPSYLNALTGKGVHVVTVNDYLAKRDAEWMGGIHRFLGLSVGCVYPGISDTAKRDAYKSDITYGQNNEFGFDYLRDNMKFSIEEQFQRGHNFAIVDEVDSILIDEARTPLIISGPAEDATDKYHKVNQILPRLEKELDYTSDLKTKQPMLTEKGVARCEELLEVENLYDPQNLEILHHVNQSLKAHVMLQRDVDYVVNNGQIVIVDEFTGRLMQGRRWSDGLHQAVEAKEGVKIARENQTLASITFQNYFRMYSKLSGMTGTADTEAVEFSKIYKLEVVVIPSNRKRVRRDENDQVYRARKEKYQAVVEDLKEIHEEGQPILVGTISIEQSETLSKMLEREGIRHNVLNAKAHEREAEIIAQAGRFKAVTISTNMAGRGTDILLGGNPEFMAMAESGTKDRTDPSYIEAFKKYEKLCAEEREKVIAAGGLFVIGTERHESRRIDNQLRGRAGRQGDPGASRFYISLEDDLMRRFAGDKIQRLMSTFGWEEGMNMASRMVSNSIETAQKRVEAFHFDSRKHVTEYDDVMNKQRQVIYALRTRTLGKSALKEELFEWVEDLVEEIVLNVCDEKVKPQSWNLDTIRERFKFLFNIELSLKTDIELDAQKIFDYVREQAKRIYQSRKEDLNRQLSHLRNLSPDAATHFDFSPEEIEQDIVLKTLDHLWLNHLQIMDHLRDGIGLRGYGQKNPLHEYQREGFNLFQDLLKSLKENVVRQLYYYRLPEPREYIAMLEAEERRRAALTKQIELNHQQGLDGSGVSGNSDGSGGDITSHGLTPEQHRAKLAEQRKARRKARRY
jgi:preprotein translocase subunit SecA